MGLRFTYGRFPEEKTIMEEVINKKTYATGTRLPRSGRIGSGQAGSHRSSSGDCNAPELGSLALGAARTTSQQIHVNHHICKNDPDSFCYMCGEYKLKKNLNNISDRLKDLYKSCFKLSVLGESLHWKPNFICGACVKSLQRWDNGKNFNTIKYNSPTIWRKPAGSDDCYFCKTIITRKGRFDNVQVLYGQVSSVDAPILKKKNNSNHMEIEEAYRKLDDSFEDNKMDMDDDENIIRPEEEEGEGDDDETEEDEEEQSYSDESSDDHDDYKSVQNRGQEEKWDQSELNDLVRDLGLSKQKAELLASRIKEKGHLKKGTKITYYRNREDNFLQFFTEESNLVYCHDIPGLMNQIDPDIYVATDWRLFIDSSTQSLKVVLLHNRNIYGSVPIAHSVLLNESYDNMKLLLEKIKYNEHKWSLCGDLKVLTMILGQQKGFTKNPCFLCMWDSRDRSNHYKKKIWDKRTGFEPGSKNIEESPLVDPKKVLLPPLHIKLGLIKQFIKSLNKQGTCFLYLIEKFPKKSVAKITEGVFDGPQIRQLIKDAQFIKTMNITEKKAWLSFCEVATKYLGNHRAQNYKEIVKNLLVNFEKQKCLMSYKVHLIDSHIDYFPENLGDYSEEQGERFHQDLKEIEKRYQGRWDKHMLSDYCWSLKREEQNRNHKRKSRIKSFREQKAPPKKKRKITLQKK